MILTLHGTGAGDPVGNRMASALSVTFSDGSVILFDAGEGCSRGMLRDGIDPMRITTVMISHMHADHWAGLPNLLMGWSVNKRKSPATIYIPPHTAEFFENLHSITYNFRELLAYDLMYNPLGTIALPDGWEASIFATRHLERVKGLAERYGHAPTAYGYVLTNGDRKIVLSQDIAGHGDLRGVITGAEVVICEAAHTDPLKVLELARDSGVRRVVFTHVPPQPPVFPKDFERIIWDIAFDGYRIEL